MAPSPSPRPARRTASLLVALALVMVAVVALAVSGATRPGLAGGNVPPASPSALALAAPSGSTIASQPAATPTSTPAASGSASLAPPASVAPSVPPAPTAPPDSEPPSATGARRAALDERLDQLRERAAVPGVSVAVIFPDGTTWLGQSGLADVKAEVPVRAETAFAVASVTKTFTAALILDLVDDGLIGLDDPVVRYLPDLEIDAKTTVRQLLDHTSGLYDFFLHPRIDKALLGARDASWDAEQALDYVGKAYFRPGRGWHYSNTNYLVLGMLAESVTGDSLDELYRSRLLAPLGLDDTVYQPAGAAEGPVARGYRFRSVDLDERAIDLSDGTGVVPFTSVVTAAAAAGGMASSARDIAAWGRALYSGQVLEPASLGAMLGDIERTAEFKPRVPYGLGVQAFEIDRRASFGHSGRLLGFRAVLRHLPADGITIAVLTNQSRVDPATIARALLQVATRPIEHCLCTGRD